MILTGRCNQGRGPCRANIEVPDGATVTVLAYPHSGNTQAVECHLSPKQALPYLVWCLDHRSPFSGRPLRLFPSTDPCGDACRSATGTDCRCTCRGQNHGIDAS